MSLSDGKIIKEPALNHFDEKGQAHMVDVSSKTETLRIATATGRIKVSPPVYAAIEGGTARKGDVLGVARLAGIMAAKKTSDLIPLCHPLPLTAVSTALLTIYDMCKAIDKGMEITGIHLEEKSGGKSGHYQRA